jgi:hypothetical protein
MAFMSSFDLVQRTSISTDSSVPAPWWINNTHLYFKTHLYFTARSSIVWRHPENSHMMHLRDIVREPNTVHRYSLILCNHNWCYFRKLSLSWSLDLIEMISPAIALICSIEKLTCSHVEWNTQNRRGVKLLPEVQNPPPPPPEKNGTLIRHLKSNNPQHPKNY